MSILIHRNRIICFVMTVCFLSAMPIVALGQSRLVWDQPAFGVFGFGSSWSSGQAPNEGDLVRFGTRLGTTLSPNTIQFISSHSVRSFLVESGNYDIRFGNPGLELSVTQTFSTRIGSSYSTSDFEADLLPDTAKLRIAVPEFSALGSVTVAGLFLGGDDRYDESFNRVTVGRDGILELDDGVEFNVIDEDDGRGIVDAGYHGSTGTINVLGGSKFKAHDFGGIYLGGMVTSGIGFNDRETRQGFLNVIGRDSLDAPSLVEAFTINVGSTDRISSNDRRTASFGEMLIDEGGVVRAESVFVGATARPRFSSLAEGDFNAEFNLPQDSIVVKRGTNIDVTQSSRLETENLTLAAGLLDLGAGDDEGGIILVGEMPDDLVPRTETLYVGTSGSLSGYGNIIGDVELFGGGQIRVSPDTFTGILEIDGNLNALSFISLRISGLEPGIGYDQIVVSGNASIQSTISINVGDIVLPLGSEFRLIKASNANFDGSRVSIFGAGSDRYTFSFSDGVVTVIGVTELGDINLDGVVDFLDIGPFISILSVNGYLASADINEDGMVTFLDIQPFIEILSGQ